MKEQRDFTRYSCQSSSGRQILVRIGDEADMTGTVLDLSTGGFSFVIESGLTKNIDINLEKFLFVQLNADGFTINAEVERRWSLVKNDGNKKIFTAGVSFNIISSEDRLRLNEIIEYIRSGSSEFYL